MPEELKETAISWAADVFMADGVLADKSKAFIEVLATKLSVGSDMTTKIFEFMAIRNRTLDKGAKADLIR